jgi:hypothetical protein
VKFFEEITEWKVGYEIPNHIYYFSDNKSKCVGYIRKGTSELIKFKTAMSIDHTGRKFRAVDMPAEPDSVYFEKVKPNTQSNTVEVKGSSGDVYSVTKNGDTYSCTCTGFSFRRKCRHIDSVKDKLCG